MAYDRATTSSSTTPIAGRSRAPSNASALSDGDQYHHHHVSIASLRSKFENLAHGAATAVPAASSHRTSLRTPAQSIPSSSTASPTPLAPMTGPGPASVLAPQPGNSGQSPPPLPPVLLPRAVMDPWPSASHGTHAAGSRPTSPAASTDRAAAAHPIRAAVVSHPLPNPPVSGFHNPLSHRATSPCSLSPRPASPVSLGAVAPASPSPPIAAASTRALLGPSASSPSLSSIPSVSVFAPSSPEKPARPRSDEVVQEHMQSVKALRDRFAFQPSPPSQPQPPSQDRPAQSSQPETQWGAVGPPPPPPTPPPPCISSAPSARPLPMAPPAIPQRDPSLAAAPAPPEQRNPKTAVKARGPPPPPPLSRSASPALSDGLGTRQVLTASPTPASRSSSPSLNVRPPPPPPKGPLSPHPSTAAVTAGPPPPTPEKPPPLPLRKQSIGLDAPPPLPTRKQSLAVPSLSPTSPVGSLAVPHAHDEGGGLPVRKSSLAAPVPTLPPRRGPEPPAAPSAPATSPMSYSKSPTDMSPIAAAAASSAAPPVPLNKPRPPPTSFRSAALAAVAISSSRPPPLPGNKPIAPSFSTSAPSAPVPGPPAPLRRATLSPGSISGPIDAVTPQRPIRQGSFSIDGFHPLPPPLRTAGTAAPPPPSATGAAGLRRNATVSGVPSRRNGANGHDYDLSDDDDEEGPIQPPSSLAQRLLEEHPDTSQANRRPPQFSPGIKITASSQISAFAVHGRFACVGHHLVRIFDTQLGSDSPMHQLDLRDTGLEWRSKDPKVTAMGFRPSLNPADEGRFLWCGSKDGHLWEIDVRSGDITATRTSVHVGQVTHILHHQRFMLTIDDTGKMNVWEIVKAHDALDTENVKSYRPPIRLSDRITFAKMIKGRLWTSTAPAVRSTTNTGNTIGARGPTIRVYDPCTATTVPPPQTALTSEWTGAATSATVMPMDPDTVLLGHEGGFVSIWSQQEELVCQQVLRISTTDILSLEGVGERLWAGNRKGQIHVYDITYKPWRATNVWNAHHLVVDPASTKIGRFMLWSACRDQLVAWDGLLGVDWVGNRMAERQPDYCEFREIKALVCSWNIDSAKPTDLGIHVENSLFLEQVLTSVDSPDIIVFGFQEVIPLTDKKLTAKTLLFGSKSKEGGTTNDRVSSAYRAWADKLESAVRLAMPPSCPYVKVNTEQLVGLFTCVFVKASERDNLRDVNITTVKRGFKGVYGNKGAIVARMVLDDTSICFINVHLAAGQRHKSARNADLAAIMEDKAVFPQSDKLQSFVMGGDGTGILDHEVVILNGDLNYRIDQRREIVESSIKLGDLAFLLENDQLRKEMRGNHAFRLRNFAEAPITFDPTYKYDRGTDSYDSSEKRRIPAWCDRILFTKSPRVYPINYQRYEITVSDHRPVSAAIALQIKHVDPVAMHLVTKEVMVEWRDRENHLLQQMSRAYAPLY